MTCLQQTRQKHFPKLAHLKTTPYLCPHHTHEHTPASSHLAKKYKPKKRKIPFFRILGQSKIPAAETPAA